MEKKLEVKNLQVSFRTQNGLVKAVRDISFDLHKGETFAIVGESGSGKSVTSKSIIGILSGNAVVEGGEILYDGQDLLKIQEEDFHKLRGDKIAMIFQDPMSSLSPIMKVGKQLTEAMILKAKMSKKAAKKNFNSKLKVLNSFMNDADSENIVKNNELIKTFDSFAISSINVENIYNDAVAASIELTLRIDEMIFLLENKQKVDYKKSLTTILENYEKSKHQYLVVENVKLETLSNTINTIIERLKTEQDVNLIIDTIKQLNLEVNIQKDKERPNFFTLGFYLLNNNETNLKDMSIEEMNIFTRDYLDKNFMDEFISQASKGLIFANNITIEKKKEIIPLIENVIEYFRKDEITLSESKKQVKDLIDKVKDSINPIELVKYSIQYSFGTIIDSTVTRYFKGVKNNPKEQSRFDKQQANYDKIIAKGKTPNGKVVPAVLVDLDLAKGNIRKILYTLRDSLSLEVENYSNYDANKKVVDLIDYLKEQTTLVVTKMNKQIAKAKAIKLLEEVGIPEPSVRYEQYPFQFSGGMRQRVVIAIALSANPDILICDEPTTALDVTIQAQILDLINKLKVERNLSVIFITHDLGVVATMADRISVMYAGKIVEMGLTDEIFYSPAHPYTWALLSSMPDLDTKDTLEAIPGTPPNMIYPPKGDAFADRNKYALEIDFEQQPPLFEITPTHYAATWLLHPDAPKVELPQAIQRRIDKFNASKKPKEVVKEKAVSQPVMEEPKKQKEVAESVKNEVEKTVVTPVTPVSQPKVQPKETVTKTVSEVKKEPVKTIKKVTTTTTTKKVIKKADGTIVSSTPVKEVKQIKEQEVGGNDDGK